VSSAGESCFADPRGEGVTKVLQGFPQTRVHSMRDELNRLRDDLTEIWQRLEDLQQVLDNECPSGREPFAVEPPADDPSERGLSYGEFAMDDLHLETADKIEASPAQETDLVPLVAAEQAGAGDEDADSYPLSEEDQSIRDYLERLLERVSAERPSRMARPASDEPTNEPAAVVEDFADLEARMPETVEGPADEPAPSVQQTAFARSASDASQRCGSRPPATPGRSGEPAGTDIRAMRALANVAAQTVIMEFESKKHAKLAMDKLLVMLVCLPCGLLLLYWYSVHRLGLTYIAASIAFFAVALWGCQAIQFFARVLAARLSLAQLWRDRDTQH
jgi:hypothetical protein